MHIGRVVLHVVGVDRRKVSVLCRGELRLQLTDGTHIALTTELLSCGDVYNPGNLLEVAACWS